ncbi:hypothetical protein MKX03_000312 [Papaver bracteatum]|uniref:antimicrobial peptide 1-like n=1 Tax=Papaver somniferum TaxID=3469 RepID=UPI000E7057C1|nr:antimicrobial peptide 1-like [Papaver somniferum]KAI3834703.1 hypothetical protein MKX03_000312 [Papaver bracteatum]
MAANKNSLSMLFMALVLMAVVSELANASSLTVFGGPGCRGGAARYDRCGCSSFSLSGGYQFVYTGQTASMYNQAGCRGVSSFGFNANANGCHSIGWRSIFIQC